MAPNIEIDEVVTEVTVGDDTSPQTGEGFERLVEAVARRLEQRQRRNERRRRDTRIDGEEQR